MHRQRTRLAARIPGRAKPVAKAVERSGIVATYALHDRVLSNRTSRKHYAEAPPTLTDAQQRVIDAVDTEGYATLPFTDLVTDETLRAAVLEQGASFVESTERGLKQDGNGSTAELRRRPGKEFLVRAHSFDGVRLGLDHAWFRACVSSYLLDLANAYLRMWAKLSYVDLWYTVPQAKETERVASQLWHFDFDDRHLLKAFLYLDDVDEETGPFEYVAGSQPGGPYADAWPWKPLGQNYPSEGELEQRVPESAVQTFVGPKATLVFCNTSGFHRGGFSTTTPRILATATYSSPASLASLTERSYSYAGSLDEVDDVTRFALS
jgi:hypothetical protein